MWVGGCVCVGAKAVGAWAPPRPHPHPHPSPAPPPEGSRVVEKLLIQSYVIMRKLTELEASAAGAGALLREVRRRASEARTLGTKRCYFLSTHFNFILEGFFSSTVFLHLLFLFNPPPPLRSDPVYV